MYRLLKPSFPDFMFLAVLCWLFAFSTLGFSSLLEDGDTGWHIRAGEYMLDHGQVPAHDIFSFSKPGQPWYAWEWGSDVIFALLFRAAGLKGVTLFAGSLISLFALLLLRLTLARGASPLFAVATTFMAVSACSLHFLARPHLFTLILVPITAWILDRHAMRHAAGERDWMLWLLVPITAVWTNLHGGFLAGIALIGLYFLGSIAEIYWNGKSKDAEAWYLPKRLFVAGALCGAATFANPYGYQLHIHLVEFMRTDWFLNAVQEFQSPSFRAENVRVYEMLLFAGLFAAGLGLARRAVCPALIVLFWAHESLSAVRHITIYASLAAPVLAWELTVLWRRFADGAPRKSLRAILDELATDSLPNFGHTSLWPAAGVAVLALVPMSTVQWPTDFPNYRFPTKIVARHEEEFRAAARPLTSDTWGSYLIFRNYPKQRIYLDGRGDFYGEKLSREYVEIMNAGKNWHELVDRNDFDIALIPVEWPLGSLLRQDPNWELVDTDSKTLYFERTGNASKIAQR